MRILLVRHGQSRSNVDGSENLRVADHAIALSPDGEAQARRCGEFLGDWLDANAIAPGSPPRLAAVRLWHSPYLRTRQTASIIEAHCRLRRDVLVTGDRGLRAAGDSCFLDRKEHVLLAEQQFGIFDGLSDAEREARYPDFHAYYEKCKRFEGKLWPKMPLGESRFEVCQRVHQSFGTFQRDASRHGIETIVVVGHGTTNRAFVMMWLHLPYEWMHEEPNPGNCSVRLIEDGEDRGYVFEGFENPEAYLRAPTKETEE